MTRTLREPRSLDGGEPVKLLVFFLPLSILLFLGQVKSLSILPSLSSTLLIRFVLSLGPLFFFLSPFSSTLRQPLKHCRPQRVSRDQASPLNATSCVRRVASPVSFLICFRALLTSLPLDEHITNKPADFKKIERRLVFPHSTSFLFSTESRDYAPRDPAPQRETVAAQRPHRLH